MQENDKSLDPFDLRLLAALQDDGALTNQDLADRVGLSPSQCSRRRARLETAGIIRRYRADLDPAALGLGILVFVRVTLATHNPDNARRFRGLVAITPAIQEAHVLAGDADYLLKVVVPGLAALSELVNHILLPHEAVARVRSDIVLETLTDANRLPISPKS